jgi:hypothetical protein
METLMEDDQEMKKVLEDIEETMGGGARIHFGGARGSALTSSEKNKPSILSLLLSAGLLPAVKHIHKRHTEGRADVAEGICRFLGNVCTVYEVEGDDEEAEGEDTLTLFLRAMLTEDIPQILVHILEGEETLTTSPLYDRRLEAQWRFEGLRVLGKLAWPITPRLAKQAKTSTEAQKVVGELKAAGRRVQALGGVRVALATGKVHSGRVEHPCHERKLHIIASKLLHFMWKNDPVGVRKMLREECSNELHAFLTRFLGWWGKEGGVMVMADSAFDLLEVLFPTEYEKGREGAGKEEEDVSREYNVQVLLPLLVRLGMMGLVEGALFGDEDDEDSDEEGEGGGGKGKGKKEEEEEEDDSDSDDDSGEEPEDMKETIRDDLKYTALVTMDRLCQYGQCDGYSARCHKHIERLVRYVKSGKATVHVDGYIAEAIDYIWECLEKKAAEAAGGV